ncbi:MAG: hypothetical protein J6Y07_02370 [Alphaproteobacteria bacterium]|nr:hypothetical protein [Alphaproteobacteria bacterium]
MKVKVKGLVFAGFAAAIFAANAMAAQTNLNTVTSKSYVDGKFNTAFGGTEGQIIKQGATAGTTTYETPGNSASAIDATAGDGKLVTGKAVAEALSAAGTIANNIQGDTDYITTSDILDAQNNVVGKRVSIITGNLADTNELVTNTSATGYDADKLVTAGAVSSLIDTSIGASEDNSTFPTSLAVKTYVDSLESDLSAVNNIQGDGTYTNVTTVNTGTEQAPVYAKQVNVITANLADNNAKITGTLDATGQAKLVTAGAVKSLLKGTIASTDDDTTVATSKAVYDYVSSQATTDAATYQTKVAAGSTGVYVGARNAGDTDSTWNEIRAAATTGTTAANTAYVTMTQNNGVYTINLASGQIADSNLADSGQRLTTENAVVDYVQSQMNGMTIPALSTNTDCLLTGAVCALVSNSNGTLEWTVLAGSQGTQPENP